LCVAPFAAQAASGRDDLCKEAPPPPEPWTSWSQSGNAIAGGEAAFAPRLILGKPVVASLRPVSQVQFAAASAESQPKTHGGLFSLAVKEPARVGIALSDPAGVDMVTERSPVPSVGHGHGPECSGISKIVWFDLRPGVHLVQIFNASGREIRIMAADAQANRPAPPLRNQDD